MTTLHVDIETYSDVDLRTYGVYRYAGSPNFKILLLAYAVDDDPIDILDLANGDKIPKDLLSYLSSDEIQRRAFNAQFERVCLSQILTTGEWECIMVKAASLGLNGSLASVGRALNIAEDKQKLETGKNLIRLFSLPRKPSKANGMKTVFTSEDKPEEWLQFQAYCINDVEAERAIDQKLSFLKRSDTEKKIWNLDQKINDTGVALDLDLAEAATFLDGQQSAIFEKRYKEISGLASPRMLGKLKDWIHEKTGEEVTAITKGNLPILIEKYKKYPDIVEALEIRQRLSRSSVSKYKAMQKLACDDGRARGLFRFYGASTGRWAGRGIQPQNLPRNYLKDLDLAREVIRERDLELIQMMYEDPSDVLSQCIRTAIVPAQGKAFAVADFSAIEARVIAWLTGESWRLEVFKDHGKIYEASASQMFGIPIDKIDYSLRQKGKVAELALGYQGSTGALKQMGALEMGLKEEELLPLVDQWRSTNPAIVAFWRDLEDAVKECIRTRAKQEIKGLQIDYHHAMLFITLPSSRELAYPKATIRPHHKFPGAEEIAYSELNRDGSWKIVSTYGGKLTENVIQAIARDCLVEAMLRIDEAGHKIVMHIHDEVVVECDKDTAGETLEEMLELMRLPISWAEGLPLNADGFTCDYYQKD